MEENNTMENENDNNEAPLDEVASFSGEGNATKDKSSHDMSNDGSAQQQQKMTSVVDNNQEGVNDNEEEEEEEDAALAQMMAFQEEQEEEAASSAVINPTDVPPTVNNENNVAAAVDNNNNNNIIEDVNLDDPNIAILDNNDNDDDDDEQQQPPPHPNLNNPAAIALRARQALQNQQQRNANNLVFLQNQPYIIRKLYILLRPLLYYTPLSIMAALLLLHHTLRTRQQFYLTMIYLQSSKLAYIVLGNAIIAMGVSTFTLMTKLFLNGGLRRNERDAIGEHIRWDVTETCLALTIFRSELDVVTAIEFLGLVIMKCLHWSVDLRGNHLRMTEEVFIYPEEEEEEEENVENNNPTTDAPHHVKKAWYRRIPHLRLTHIRYYTLVEILLMLDILAVAHCALSVATHGPSVDILFGFEAAILLVSGLSSLGMYNLHIIDGVMGVLHHFAEGEHHHVPVGGMADEPEDQNNNGVPTQEASAGEGDGAGDNANADGTQHQEGGNAAVAIAEDARPPATRTKTFARKLVERLANPWRDRRATLSFAIELQAQAAKFLFYVVFFAIVFTYYGMPINIFREVYVSFQQLRRRLIAFNTYRRLTHNMEKRFESIKDEEELNRLGHTCIICRDQLDLSGGCKKLPCGHAFHTHCLREWLVQQQTCPTCRSDIAAGEARRKKELERETAAAAAAEAADRRGEGGDATNTADTNNSDGAVSAGANAEQSQTDTSTTDTSTTQPGVAQKESQQALDQSGDASNTDTVTSPQPKQSDESKSMPDNFKSSWTAHVDDRSGRTYYFNKVLGKSSWDNPGVPVTGQHEVAHTSDRAQAANRSSAQFPCLYRVTFPAGAPVFPASHSPSPYTNGMIASTQPPPRIIPCGKMVVCLAIEYWPLPFQEAMLCTPDGYVRSRDVERFMMLGSREQSGTTKCSTKAASAMGLAH